MGVEAMSIHTRSWIFAQRYGESFVAWLNDRTPSQWTDVVRDDDFYKRAVQGEDYYPSAGMRNESLRSDSARSDLSEECDVTNGEPCSDVREGFPDRENSSDNQVGDGNHSSTPRPSSLADHDRNTPLQMPRRSSPVRPVRGPVWCTGACFLPQTLGKGF